VQPTGLSVRAGRGDRAGARIWLRYAPPPGGRTVPSVRSQTVTHGALARMLIGVLLLVGAMATGPAARAASPTQVGLPTPGQTMFQFVGRIDQVGPLSDDFGYVSELAGMDEADLYAGGDPLGRTEGTARFTYFSSARLQGRAVNGNLFITQGAATTTVYYSEAPAGASFDDPASFKRGTPVAVFEGTWQDIVNVQAPNTGIATIVSDMSQTAATAFTLGGTEYRFGAQGATIRLGFSGEGTRTDPTTPRATILYGGDAILTGTPAGRVSGVEVVGASDSVARGWAYAAFALGGVALGLTIGSLVASRRRSAMPPTA
jgi:hypothetical protein